MSIVNFEIVNAMDIFGDNNKGYKHGIHWLNKYDEVIECEWHKTIKTMKKAIFNQGFNGTFIKKNGRIILI